MAFIESGKSFDKEKNHKKMNARLNSLESVQYPLRIPANIYKKMKVKAAQEGVTIKAVLTEMIMKYIGK